MICSKQNMMKSWTRYVGANKNNRRNITESQQQLSLNCGYYTHHGFIFHASLQFKVLCNGHEYLYNEKKDLAIKMNGTVPFAEIWMDLETVA